MPWTPESFRSKHNKGLSSDKSGEAAKIANGVLRKTGDEGKAIRIANWMVDRNRYRSAEKRGGGNGA